MSHTEHLPILVTTSTHLRVASVTTALLVILGLPVAGAAQSFGETMSSGASSGMSAGTANGMSDSMSHDATARSMDHNMAPMGIAVGTKAPGAEVEALDGQAVDLARYIGTKPLVLEFWATWCPLCKQLEPAVQAAEAKYGDRVTFVGVGVHNNQTPAKERAYVATKHLGGVYVFDQDGKAVAAYKAPHTSYLVVVDAAGTVVYTGAGGDQDVDAAVAKALPMSPGMNHNGR